MATQTIAHDAAVAATAHLEEHLGLSRDDAAVVLAVIVAAVEAALVLERRRLLEVREN